MLTKSLAFKLFCNHSNIRFFIFFRILKHISITFSGSLQVFSCCEISENTNDFRTLFYVQSVTYIKSSLRNMCQTLFHKIRHTFDIFSDKTKTSSFQKSERCTDLIDRISWNLRYLKSLLGFDITHISISDHFDFRFLLSLSNHERHWLILWDRYVFFRSLSTTLVFCLP